MTQYFLCPWTHGCSMPTSTDPSRTTVLCRWHQYCVRQEYPAQAAGDFQAFATWLEDMQHSYPGNGIWSKEVGQVWGMVRGKR